MGATVFTGGRYIGSLTSSSGQYHSVSKNYGFAEGTKVEVGVYVWMGDYKCGIHYETGYA